MLNGRPTCSLFVFLHTPATGGRSLLATIRQSRRLSCISTDKTRRLPESDACRPGIDRWRYGISAFTNASFVAGRHLFIEYEGFHTLKRVLNTFNRDIRPTYEGRLGCKLITGSLFREPIRQAQAHWRHFGDPRNHELAHKNTSFIDHACRVVRSQHQTFGTCLRSEDCYRNLDWIGVTDEWRRSLCMLSSLLRVRLGDDLFVTDPTNVPRTQATAEERQRVEQLEQHVVPTFGTQLREFERRATHSGC